MTPILLQVSGSLADKLSGFLSNSDGKIATALQQVEGVAHDLGAAAAAFGIFLSLVFLIIPVFTKGGEFNVDALIKLLLMAAVFGIYKPAITAIDAILKVPGEKISTMSDDATAKGELAMQEYLKKYDDALTRQQETEKAKNDGIIGGVGKSAQDAMTDLSITFSPGNIMTMIWMGVTIILLVISYAILFLIKFASMYGSQLLISLGSISVGFSFIKGFEGSMVGMIKYLVVFRLWVVVAGTIKLAATSIGFLDPIIEATANIDAMMASAPGQAPAIPDFSSLIIMFCFIVMMCLTPMFADTLISGSQSGGIFSAAMAKGSSIMGRGGSSIAGIGGNSLFGKKTSGGSSSGSGGKSGNDKGGFSVIPGRSGGAINHVANSIAGVGKGLYSAGKGIANKDDRAAVSGAVSKVGGMAASNARKAIATRALARQLNQKSN